MFGLICPNVHSAPIADLIKTPSRTATAKKTRAFMTATMNRAEQVKAFNARLALSPLADKSPAVSSLVPVFGLFRPNG